MANALLFSQFARREAEAVDAAAQARKRLGNVSWPCWTRMRRATPPRRPGHPGRGPANRPVRPEIHAEASPASRWSTRSTARWTCPWIRASPRPRTWPGCSSRPPKVAAGWSTPPAAADSSWPESGRNLRPPAQKTLGPHVRSPRRSPAAPQTLPGLGRSLLHALQTAFSCCAAKAARPTTTCSPARPRPTTTGCTPPEGPSAHVILRRDYPDQPVPPSKASWRRPSSAGEKLAQGRRKGRGRRSPA